MKNKQRKTQILSPYVLAGALCSVFFLCLAAPLAHAAVSDALLGGETKALIDNLSGTSPIKGPGAVVFGVVQIILGFLGIVGVIMMMYAGFLWLTAGGEEEKTTKGRTLLFQAVIGTFIVLVSYTATYFVLREFAAAVTGLR